MGPISPYHLAKFGRVPFDDLLVLRREHNSSRLWTKVRDILEECTGRETFVVSDVVSDCLSFRWYSSL